MFNKQYIASVKREYIPYEKSVKITEHKAPTDESLKLLREMKEEVKSEIIHSIVLKDNILNAVGIFFQNGFVFGGNSLSVRCMIKYVLNGKEMRFEKEFSLSNLSDNRHPKSYVFMKAFISALSEHLSVQIMKSSGIEKVDLKSKLHG